MIFDVLQVFKNNCELILLNELTARDEDPNGKKFDVLRPIVSRKDEFPYSKGIKERKVLSIEKGDPSEAVKEGVDLEFLHSFPNAWFDSLDKNTFTMSISLTSLNFP